MRIKPLLKHAAQQILLGDHPAFVIASFGRSGSTLIYDAILNGISKCCRSVPYWVSRRIARDTAWQLDKTTLLRGVIYKTHDYPDALAGRQDVKSVFLFGSAVEAALSVYSCRDRYGAEWVKEHFRHLRSDLRYDDLFKCDALRFRNQILAWCGFAETQVLCLRYESIWDHQRTLEEYCGFKVPLPPQRPRAKKTYSQEIEAAAHTIYGPIDEMINRLPDVFTGSPEMRKGILPKLVS